CEILSDCDSLPRLRPGTSVSLSLGDNQPTGLHPPGGVSEHRLLGSSGVSAHRRGCLSLCVEKRGISMAIELSDSVVLTQLDHLANWVRKNSLWPMPFATACCGIELMAT